MPNTSVVRILMWYKRLDTPVGGALSVVVDVDSHQASSFGQSEINGQRCPAASHWRLGRVAGQSRKKRGGAGSRSRDPGFDMKNADGGEFTLIWANWPSCVSRLVLPAMAGYRRGQRNAFVSGAIPPCRPLEWRWRCFIVVQSSPGSVAIGRESRGRHAAIWYWRRLPLSDWTVAETPRLARLFPYREAVWRRAIA